MVISTPPQNNVNRPILIVAPVLDSGNSIAFTSAGPAVMESLVQLDVLKITWLFSRGLVASGRFVVD